MIGYLKGDIIHRGNNFIILDVVGVGYKVYVPNFQFPISNFQFFIHHHVREEASDLYGFQTVEELEFFELLLNVPGVGPKVAMNIMAAGNVQKLRDSIIKSDSAALTAIGGIGSKVAAKIIVELKPKLMRGSTVDVSRFGESSQELVDALMSLSYNRGEISRVLGEMPTDFLTTQQKITWALKHLQKS